MIKVLFVAILFHQVLFVFFHITGLSSVLHCIDNTVSSSIKLLSLIVVIYQMCGMLKSFELLLSRNRAICHQLFSILDDLDYKIDILECYIILIFFT